jgi:hypothetical protein
MFNLFGKKEASVKVIDKIWMSEKAKWNGLLEQWKKNPELILITWFDVTLHQLETFFAKEINAPVSLYNVREIHRPQLEGRQIIFTEHHPLRKKEQELFIQWQLSEAVVYSSMDEPLFQQFGGEKIIQLMKQLGMPEEGVVEHKMISSSIQNAQEKIEKKVTMEHTAPSQQQWMERNLPA